jgi:hypothetical protein
MTGYALKRKLVVAIEEKERQIEAFKQCNRTVERDVQKLWQAEIDAWLADKRKPSPYALPRTGEPSFCLRALRADHILQTVQPRLKLDWN